MAQPAFGQSAGFDSTRDPNVVPMLSGFNWLEPAYLTGPVDAKTVEINNGASAQQRQEALAYEQYPFSRKSLATLDYTGLQAFYERANAAGQVPLVNELLAQGNYKSAGSSYLEPEWTSSDNAKSAFNYLRPYCRAGIAPLIQRTGSASYDSCANKPLGYPSGHSRIGWHEGIGLAAMLPEVGPQIMARAAETTNGRVVLGVHSPLDVMAGRAVATRMVASRLDDPVWKARYDAARNQLRSAIEAQCGKAIAECLKANPPKLRTDQAVQIERAYLTYDLPKVGAANLPLVAPAHSQALLSFAMPTASAAQREAVLDSSSVDSGYPLDTSGSAIDAGSIGWTRIDLGKALASLSPTSPDPSGAPSTVYNPLAPSRLIDTRESSMPIIGVPTSIPVLGRGGVPTTGVDSVVLNVTAVSATGPGFFTVYPSGTSLPTASNVNYVKDQTVANQVIAKVGADGAVRIAQGNAPAHMVVDVAGYFAAGASFKGVQPTRLVDTRVPTGVASAGAVKAGSSTPVQVTGLAGIPATGVDSVVLNVTTTGSRAPGFFTLYPSNLRTVPTASNLNHAAGETVAAMVVAKVGSDGRIKVYSLTDTQLIVDVAGYIPKGAGFTGMDPIRLLDTRLPGGLVTGKTKAEQIIELPVRGVAGVPASATSVELNLTVTEASGPGHATAYPQGATPTASNLNYAKGDTRANSVTARIGSDGKVRLFVHASTHLIVDVAGWWTS